MNNHKKIILLIILSLFTIFLIYNFTFSKYATDISGKSSSQIANPVIELVGSNKIVGKDYDDTARQIEYNFSVNNFDSKENINQVNLKYIIKITNDNLDFPISYKLYSSDNEEISLNGSNTTDFIMLDKDVKETHNYKLIIKYADKGNGINIINKLKLKHLK